MTMDLAAYLLNDTEPTDEEILDEVAHHLAAQEPTSEIDLMEQKLAAAYRAGIKLAREHGDRALMDNVERNAEELEKTAFVDQIAGGVIGHHYGKKQVERGEGHTFGGKQIASMLFLPGGIGYQIGRGMAHGDAAKEMRDLAKKIEGGTQEKKAWAPLLAAGARLLGGQAAKGVASQGVKGMLGNVAKEVGQNVVVDKATNALTRPRQAVQQAPQMGPSIGGFKYAGIMDGLNKSVGAYLKKNPVNFSREGAGTIGQRIVGGMVRNPGAALVGVGALGGAVMAPRDPVTGEKQYLRGAVTGGAIGGGAYALGAGNKLRHAVMSPKGPQILGERAGAYARDATKATYVPHQRSGGVEAMGGLRNDLSVAPHSAPIMSGEPLAPHLPSPPPASVQVPSNGGPVPLAAQAAAGTGAQYVADDIAASQRGIGGRLRGLMGGNINVPHELQSPGSVKFSMALAKMANRQTLQYNPATKTMTRQHLTPSLASNSRVSGGGTLASPGLGLSDIKAGTTAAVPSHVSEGPRAPMTPAQSQIARPAGAQSQVFSSHGGDVLSSSPGRGVAARPQVTARPIAAPPPIPAMKSPIAAGASAALKAAPKPPALPSLAGARSLVR
jgi:hypothetical protein